MKHPTLATSAVLALGAAGVVLAGSLIAMASRAGAEPLADKIAAQTAADPDPSIESLQTDAAKGSTTAQVKLGIAYAIGRGVERNDGEAAKWFALAASRGDPRGQPALIEVCKQVQGPPLAPCRSLVADLAASAARGDLQAEVDLGSFYFIGAAGLARDPATALGWYRKAAGQGYGPASAALGWAYATGTTGAAGDSGQAIVWFRKAADQGDVGAINALALAYHEGLYGVAKDPAQAAVWTTKAANTDNPAAQLDLATMYTLGEGVPRDLAQAAHWLRKSAEGGDTNAAEQLAIAYAGGKGVARDDVQAYAWMHVAITEVVLMAGAPPNYWGVFLATVSARMTPAQIAEAETQAAALEGRATQRDRTGDEMFERPPQASPPDTARVATAK